MHTQTGVLPEFQLERGNVVGTAVLRPEANGRILEESFKTHGMLNLDYTRFDRDDSDNCQINSKYKVNHEAEYVGLVVEARLRVDEGRSVVKGFRVV
jgi:hypothetical protein